MTDVERALALLDKSDDPDIADLVTRIRAGERGFDIHIARHRCARTAADPYDLCLLALRNALDYEHRSTDRENADFISRLEARLSAPEKT